MSENIKRLSDYVNHPKEEGVLMKHFFCSTDNDRLNNLEVKIEAGKQILAHVHDNSSEFYYVVEGEGEFLIDGEWRPIKKGDALKAPMGMEHGVKNTSSQPLYLFSTFSPPTR
ncbi:MAG: cupin domain-containing protein [Clostridiaceae bacterium]|jgi:mannose-6-phosphate isomerase-like protein (cupin superfamily)|nr:cupin domain-containing protein [Clostridiaceae bacterium]